jgi:hypothetical protein
MPAGAAATRKPMLLFRLSGVFLLRLAERQFVPSLFHEPPRFTRFEPMARVRPQA